MREASKEEIEMIADNAADVEDFMPSDGDFLLIYNIRGVSGLWVKKTMISGRKRLVLMQNFETKVKSTFNINHCECLGMIEFGTLVGHRDLTMYQVFKNIEAGAVEMEDLVPAYDEDRFKDYHAKKVLDWYKILITNNKDVKRINKKENN